MGDPPLRSPVSRVALVLAGGAARGAYEVGVVRYLLEDVSRAIGRPVPIDVLCGTSVGALNACALAAFADEPPRARSSRLEHVWSGLRIEDLIRFDTRGLLGMMGRLLGRGGSKSEVPAREGGLLDPRGIENVVAKEIPFERIDANIAAGLVEAISVSTTHVVTGKTVVFVQRRDGTVPSWSSDPSIEPRAVKLRLEHALASAALPILFPAVKLGSEFHCDGGLRQNVPLSPARRLGADGLIVINPRHVGGEALAATPVEEDTFPGPLFLLGKTLNALLLDRIDSDLARLKSINRILDAGAKTYGPTFTDELNRSLGRGPERGVRPLRAILIRSSSDIGKLAGEYVRSAAFRPRAKGALGRVLFRLAEDDSRNEADLLSYLLFDGAFCQDLIRLGHEDAREHHDELCAFFERRIGSSVAPPLSERGRS
ncbi:MAG: patatin-like phospholipase family protein [Myxococcales bacterium]|nr:patatin-like phospholipase family protein [Myxococcales bacterium]